MASRDLMRGRCCLCFEPVDLTNAMVRDGERWDVHWWCHVADSLYFYRHASSDHQTYSHPGTFVIRTFA